ncbi:MAG: hypothetical protein LBJ00_04915 [Planctomycetaceae bacterium]|nr:hypothetical protein [Planctomycetaceae bacterium]
MTFFSRNLHCLYSSCFKADYASITSRSGCSRTKPTAHTGFGILQLY